MLRETIRSALLLAGLLAIGLLPVGAGCAQTAPRIDEGIDWVLLDSIPFDSPADADWEGEAEIQTDGASSHLVCYALTQLFREGALTDVRIELKVRWGSGGFGIGIRSGGSGEVEFGCNRDYHVLIRHPGVYLLETHHEPCLDQDRWYSVAFTAVEDQFMVEVDGEVWFTLQDAEPLVTPGRIRIAVNPTAIPIWLDEIRIFCPRDDLSIENLFPRVSEWDHVFEEPIEEGWNASLLTSGLGSSDWNLVLDGDHTALQVTCNCWASLPSCYTWGDYAFISRVKIDHGEATLSFRAGDEGRYYVGLQDGRLFLGKEQPWGHRTILATSTCPIELGTWYSVAIFGIGSELAVRLDGELAIRYDDRSSPLLSGGISYETCGEDPVLLIDEIEILSDEAPIDPYALLSTAEALREEGDFQAAYETLEQALELFRAVVNRSGEAEALRLMGKALASSGDLSAAIGAFRRAIEVLAAIDDRASVAWCYLDLGNVYMRLEDLASAEECFARARDSFVLLSDREGEIEALRSEGRFLLALANGFRDVGNPAETISSLAAAVRAFHDAGDKQEEANALIFLAWVYRGQGRFSDALDCLERAEPLFRSIGDSRGLRESYVRLLDCYSATGQYDLALQYGEKALAAYRADDADLGGKAWALSMLAGVYLGRGELQLAIDHLLMAISIYRDIGNMFELSELYGALSYLYYQVGDAELGDEYSRMGRDLALSSGGTILAAGLRSAGLLHRDQGDLPAAIASVEQALSMYRELGDRSGEALCLNTLADFYQAAGETQKAIELTQEVVELGREIGRPDIEFNGWTCQARIYLYAERYDESIVALEKALEITQDPNYQEAKLGVYMQFADVYINAERLVEGIEYLEQALAIAQETEAISRQMQIHGFLAEACHRIGRTEEAKTHYEETIQIIEHTFHGLEQEALQEAFFPRVRQVYVEYFNFLLSLGDLDGSLWMAERCRARTYTGRIADIGEGYLDLLPEAGIRSGVFQAEAIENDAKQVVLELPANVAAIEYFVMPNRTLVWVATGGTVHGPHSIPISSADLRNRVIEFRGAIERTEAGLSDLPDEALLVMSAELHQLLIAPILSNLSYVDHLVIVPSGSLYYLPFAALFDCPDCQGVELLGGAYLAERFTLSYTPSLATLHHAWSLPRTEESSSSLLAFADPDTGDPSLVRLPEARDEASAVAATFGHSEIYVGEQASEDLLWQSVEDARFLLISTHGVFDPANPMYSCLLFSPTSTSDGRLHTYEVFELPLQADLVTLSACETLLPALEEAKEEVRAARGLSSDEPIELTAEQLDDLVTGDDIVGLTRAFIYAGSSSVLSTLWRVVSQTTEPLMVAFYRYLQRGIDKADALRQAQLDVMAAYPHPRYWAAFELVGDWR